MQTSPHAPQLLSSVCVSTRTPLHSVPTSPPLVLDDPEELVDPAADVEVHAPLEDPDAVVVPIPAELADAPPVAELTVALVVVKIALLPQPTAARLHRSGSVLDICTMNLSIAGTARGQHQGGPPLREILHHRRGPLVFLTGTSGPPI